MRVYRCFTDGPGVFNQPYFKDAHFPRNMAEVWQAQWAFLEGYAPLVVGEIGGFYQGKDKVRRVPAACQPHATGHASRVLAAFPRTYRVPAAGARVVPTRARARTHIPGVA